MTAHDLALRMSANDGSDIAAGWDIATVGAPAGPARTRSTGRLGAEALARVTLAPGRIA
jgi:hypothetical protein